MARGRQSWVVLLMLTLTPALWVGGALPEVIVAFCGALVVAVHHQVRCGGREVVVPRVAWVGLAGAGLVLVQWLPIPGFRTVLVPDIAAHVDGVLAETGLDPWAGMSIVPGDTALEAVRMLGLTVLFVVAAQLPWRMTTAVVAATGATVAVTGFVHEALGAQAIFGLYTPADPGAMAGPALMTSFVNPNHQASLFLLGLFSAAALLIDQLALSALTTDAAASDRHRDGAFAAATALTLQLPALVLSLSRGALVAFILVAPWAIRMGMRARRQAPRPRGRMPWLLRSAVVGGFVGMMLVVAQHGAWAELQSLADLDHPGSSASNKIRLAGESLGLVELSRPLGIGRGAFMDLFGALDSRPTYIVQAHVESTPAALLVELGWLGGGALLLGLVGWWVHAYVCTWGREAIPRRLALLGLAALMVHNVLEFSMELLGVAASAVVLAGGLSGALTRGHTAVARKPARWIATVLLGAAACLAVWAAPRSSGERRGQDHRVFDGGVSGEAALRMRPLDGRLHGLIARRAAKDGDWAKALHWADLATEHRPGNPDPWLVAAAAHAALGSPDRSAASMRKGLSLLHAPPDDALIEFILGMVSTPEQLAAITPTDGPIWQLLTTALQARAPGYADAVAAAHLQAHPTDGDALNVRVQIAMAARRPALALHHARMLRALEPRDSRGHVFVAAALRSFEPPRRGQARDELRLALSTQPFASRREQGRVEEALVQTLVAIGDPQALAEARTLGAALLTRPATRGVQLRRERLVSGLGVAKGARR